MSDGQIDPRQEHDLQAFQLGAMPIWRTTLSFLRTVLRPYEATEHEMSYITGNGVGCR